MTVEILRFLLQPGQADAFVRRNEEIWTPALQERPGFVRREILQSDDDPDEVVIIVRWRDRRSLDAFPKDEQRRLEERMADLIREQDQRVYEQSVPADAM